MKLLFHGSLFFLSLHFGHLHHFGVWVPCHCLLNLGLKDTFGSSLFKSPMCEQLVAKVYDWLWQSHFSYHHFSYRGELLKHDYIAILRWFFFTAVIQRNLMVIRNFSIYLPIHICFMVLFVHFHRIFSCPNDDWV